MLTLALLPPVLAAWASEPIKALKIQCSSGADVTILLADQPKVTLADGDLVVTTLSNVFTYPASEYVKFTYIDEGMLTGLTDLGQLGMVFSLEGGCLKAKHLAPEAVVSVYTVDGKLIASVRTDAQGSATLALPEVPGGVYVVKTSAVTFKLRKS